MASHVAVVVDRLPLLRIGIRRAVDEAGFSIGAEAADLTEGIEAALRTRAGLVVVGEVDAVADAELARAAAAACVVGLVGAASRERLAGAFRAGVAGLGLRSSTTADLASMLKRVATGERVIAPALLPALAGLVTEPAEDRVVREVEELTQRERRVLAALAVGATNAEIAAELFVSTATVKTHLAHIYAKLRVANRRDALNRAVALGLVG